MCDFIAKEKLFKELWFPPGGGTKKYELFWGLWEKMKKLKNKREQCKERKLREGRLQ